MRNLMAVGLPVTADEYNSFHQLVNWPYKYLRANWFLLWYSTHLKEYNDQIQAALYCLHNMSYHEEHSIVCFWSLSLLT